MARCLKMGSGSTKHSRIVAWADDDVTSRRGRFMEIMRRKCEEVIN